MPPLLSRLTAFLLRHLLFLAGLIAGLFSGLGPTGGFFGGVLGYFGDEFRNEQWKRKCSRRFYETTDARGLDDEEILVMALALLYFRFRRPGRISPELFRNRDDMIPLQVWLDGGRRKRRILERCMLCLPEQITGECETDMILVLDSRLDRREKEGFLRLLAENPATGSPGRETLFLAERMAMLWGISRERIPALFAPREKADEHWTILGLKPGAPAWAIRKNYRMLAAHFHPDTNTELSETQQKEAGEVFLKIKKAHEVLLNLKTDSGD